MASKCLTFTVTFTTIAKCEMCHYLVQQVNVLGIYFMFTWIANDVFSPALTHLLYIYCILHLRIMSRVSKSRLEHVYG